jgi:hypothetical protein
VPVVKTMATTNRYIALADHAHKEEAETLNHTGQFHEEEVFEDSEIEPPPSGPDGGEGKINISVGAANGQTSGGNDIFADPQEMDQPQAGNDGWGEEMHISVDDDGEIVYLDTQDGDRRRKVSSGNKQEGTESDSLTFPYTPLPTSAARPGLGRGGGFLPGQGPHLGSLPPIAEGGVGMESENFGRIDDVETEDLSRLLSGTVPPPKESSEKVTTMFTF